MSEIRFEWDARKARANLAKHGVSFEEASSAFYDELGLLLDDPDATVKEDRFILLGFSSRMRLLVVVHCFREPDETIRIISARQAAQHETDLYQDQLRS
ncbi:MAG: BrnT family toxin [Vicinamibacterales bacterium]